MGMPCKSSHRGLLRLGLWACSLPLSLLLPPLPHLLLQPHPDPTTWSSKLRRCSN